MAPNKKGPIMTYEKTIIQFTKMLGNLAAMLDKAAHFADEKKIDVGILLESRLAPDQFNFIRQVQISCDTAKSAAASLANKESPMHPDTEKTLPELKARIESVILYLKSFSSKDFVGAGERQITRPRWEGKTLTGEEFLIQHAIPNFYFHLSTAYAILRHNGVGLGKKDYLGALPYKNS